MSRNGNGNGHSEAPEDGFEGVSDRALLEDIARSGELTASRVDALIGDVREVRRDLGAVRGDIASLQGGVFEAVAGTRRTEMLVEKIAKRVGAVDAKADRATSMALGAQRDASRSSWTDEVAREVATAGVGLVVAKKNDVRRTALDVVKYVAIGLVGLALGFLGHHGCG